MAFSLPSFSAGLHESAEFDTDRKEFGVKITVLNGGLLGFIKDVSDMLKQLEEP